MHCARSLFGLFFILLGLVTNSGNATADDSFLPPAPNSLPPEFLHETDLYRPYADADDHFDLACIYALAFQKRLELKTILIDFPYPWENPIKRDPDIDAVMQMNFIARLRVPIAIGSNKAFGSPTPEDSIPGTGVDAILDNLKNSANGLYIDIAGNSRDVAEAISQNPDLFKAKCRGIYLNAGVGDKHPAPDKDLEFNVKTDPKAFAKIFDAPCPVYWMPCWGGDGYGTGYKIKWEAVIPSLSPFLQRYFSSAMATGTSNWLRDLYSDNHPGVLENIYRPKKVITGYSSVNVVKDIWSTAGYFHVVGLGVDSEGKIKPLGELGDKCVFEFLPIRITCDEKGHVDWDNDPNAINRFVFHVRDQQHYSSAMQEAMKTLLQALP